VFLLIGFLGTQRGDNINSGGRFLIARQDCQDFPIAEGTTIAQDGTQRFIAAVAKTNLRDCRSPL